MRLRRGWAWGIALALLACDDGGKHGAGASDGAVAADAAHADGAVAPDAARDARVPDAAPDAQADAASDAAPPDASPPDAASRDAALPDAALPDAAPVDAAPPESDSAVPPVRCAPCAAAGDCAPLGPGAQCSMLLGGAFCTQACGPDDACPGGYRCVLGQCLPAGLRCDSCAVAGCAADRRCVFETGTCEVRVRRCGGCGQDADCEPDHTCQRLGLGRNCLPRCAPDAVCPDGFQCDGAGTCVPTAGFCDPCGGCGGARPVCNFLTGMCMACGPGTACPAGQVCDETGECVAPPEGQECRTDLDCHDAARAHCVQNACVACAADTDCPADARCDAGACVHDPCARLACQGGAHCDADTARCEADDGQPACAADPDCGDGRRCNPATGQCFRADLSCDADSPCAPGGACVPAPFGSNANVCTCARTNPADPMEPNEQHRIPCQPGGYCVQLGAQPGVCVAPPMP